MHRETQKHTDRRRLWEDRGRDWREVIISQGHLAPPEVGRGRKDPPLEPRRERSPAETLILEFRPPECERIKLCCLNLPSLW